MILFRKESGLYTVEFAIVGSLFFLIFFAVLEVARLMFTWNVLTEVSRRGARLATVCNILIDTGTPNAVDNLIESSTVVGLATFGDKKILPNFSSANLKISYLTLEGDEANYISDVQLVRAEIVNYRHDLFIPGYFVTLNSPSFKTTLVSESLGAFPGDEASSIPGSYSDCT